jgi:hypothetical protein
MNILTPARAASIRFLFFALPFLLITPSIVAQRCKPVKGLQDSTTTTHYYVKWQVHPTARSYKVSYWDSSNVVNQILTNNKARFTRTANAPFEVISVQGICPGGVESSPEFNMKGGIVITLDDIYRIRRDCGYASVPHDYVLFSDACVGVEWDIMCNAIMGLPEVDENYTVADWTDQLMLDIENDLFPWPDFADCPGEEPQDPWRAGLSITETRVFPNPLRSSCTVQIGQVHSDRLKINLIDAQGRQLWKKAFSSQVGASFQEELLLGDLPGGLYFLQVQGDGEAWYFRLLKE